MPAPAVLRRQPRISVLIPAYNHQHYIGEAIASVRAQEWPEFELLVLDDGSTDGTLEAAERAIAGETRIRCHISSQSNAGVSVTLNRLMAAADGDMVAILNSDDSYAPGRFGRLLALAQPGRSFFGFSTVRFVEADQAPDFLSLTTWYGDAMRMAAALPTAGFALLLANLSISSSNFLFSRDLVERSGGFDPALPLTQDWDFILRCLPFAEPSFAAEPLLNYRVHGRNTRLNHKATEVAQSRAVLESYFTRRPTPANALAPSPAHWPRFFPVFLAVAWQVAAGESVGHFLRRQGALPDAGSSLAPAATAALEAQAIARLVAQASGGGVADPAGLLPLCAADHWQAVRRILGL